MKIKLLQFQLLMRLTIKSFPFLPAKHNYKSIIQIIEINRNKYLSWETKIVRKLNFRREKLSTSWQIKIAYTITHIGTLKSAELRERSRKEEINSFALTSTAFLSRISSSGFQFDNDARDPIFAPSRVNV